MSWGGVGAGFALLSVFILLVVAVIVVVAGCWCCCGSCWWSTSPSCNRAWWSCFTPLGFISGVSLAFYSNKSTTKGLDSKMTQYNGHKKKNTTNYSALTQKPSGEKKRTSSPPPASRGILNRSQKGMSFKTLHRPLLVHLLPGAPKTIKIPSKTLFLVPKNQVLWS